MQIELNGRAVGDGCNPYLVAEIGQNHNGDSYVATRMIGAAAKAGADAVKFQLRNVRAEYPEDVLSAPHPDPANAFGSTYLEHRKALDITPKDLRLLLQRIRYNEWTITLFCTPCHVSCVGPLESLGMPFYKVASKDLANLELVREVGQTGKPVILSTGLADLCDIENALNAVGHNQVIVLQCTSQYPCALENVHLRAMERIRRFFSVLVGISDHTKGLQVPIMAAAMGACVVEKHFTFSKQAKGTDHAMSLEVDELGTLARQLRDVPRILGSDRKQRLECTDSFARKQGCETASQYLG